MFLISGYELSGSATAELFVRSGTHVISDVDYLKIRTQ